MRPSREGTLFKSNAVRSLVELHETEVERFYDVWERFCASGTPLPVSDDPSYASAQHLGGHVLRATRNYLTWIGEFVGRPVTDVDTETDPVKIAGRGRAFMREMLAAWRLHLAHLEDREMTPAQRKSRWGEDYNIEQMLEHAVVHPMRHRIQLERLLSA
jgi:hypothetical protein